MRNSTFAVLTTAIVSGLASLPTLVVAETTTQTSDYIAVAFEAEEYDDKGLRWVHTETGTPQQEEDPDGNHSNSASGTEYLEVLPDYRVTHEDEFHPSGSLWDAGRGPELTYSIDFPEAGRYFVHLRGYSTGTEDNGAHIGLNNDFPPAGRRMQWCRGKNQWAWSSAQRDSGGNGSCGREKTIYLDIPSAGTHTINIQAREDGFELDRVVMIKDLSNNTRVCEPVGATDINCRNGFIESADGMIDLKIQLESDIEEAAIGDQVFFSAILENLDPFDHATNVVTTLDLGAGFNYVGGSSQCTHANGVITCELADLEPTAPDESHDFNFQATVTGVGALEITASVVADEIERAPLNDTASLIVDGVSELPDVDLNLSVESTPQTLEVGERAQINITLENTSADAANGVQLVYALPEGVDLVAVPSQCILADPVVCNLGVFAGNNVQTSIIDVEATQPGAQLHAVSLSTNNDPDTSNNEADTFLVVVQPEEETETGADNEPVTDDNETTDPVVDGNEDDDSNDSAGSDETDETPVTIIDANELPDTDADSDNAGDDENTSEDSDANSAVDPTDPSINGNPAESGQANAESGGGGAPNGLLLIGMVLLVRLRAGTRAVVR